MDQSKQKKTENCQFKKQKKREERERKPAACLGFLKNYCRIFGTTHVIKQQHTCVTQEVKKLSINNDDISLFKKKHNQEKREKREKERGKIKENQKRRANTTTKPLKKRNMILFF